MKVVRFLAFFIAILACIMGYVFYQWTLIAWWCPVSCSLLIGLATLPLSKRWKWMTHSESALLNSLCHVFHVGAFCYFLLLAGNFGLADSTSRHEEKVTVLSKHIEVHKKKRRVGKYRYVSAGEQKLYFLQIAFKNGREKELRVSSRVYNTTRANESKALVLEKGFLGFDVILLPAYLN